MYSYRHGFHAANHADVLKHAVFVQILEYLVCKAGAFQVIDTHAGAGLYDLGHDWARQSGEAEYGVGRLLNMDVTDNPPPFIARYLQILTQCRERHGAQAYPGSPWLALNVLRKGDHLHLFETHPSEIQTLRCLPGLRSDVPARQITLHHADGFSAFKALLPPVSRRGVVIMDPAYEDKHDYRRVEQALADGLQRFSTGCYLVWHPVVQRREMVEMTRRLRRLPGVAWLHATLHVKQAPHDGVGLFGSGVFVINPPWTLHAELQATLPWLCACLAQDGHARFTLDTSQDKQDGQNRRWRNNHAASGRVTADSSSGMK